VECVVKEMMRSIIKAMKAKKSVKKHPICTARCIFVRENCDFAPMALARNSFLALHIDNIIYKK
jgi:hypothetical protein